MSDSVKQLMNDKVVCGTAPATPGPLIRDIFLYFTSSTKEPKNTPETNISLGTFRNIILTILMYADVNSF